MLYVTSYVCMHVYILLSHTNTLCLVHVVAYVSILSSLVEMDVTSYEILHFGLIVWPLASPIVDIVCYCLIWLYIAWLWRKEERVGIPHELRG